MGWLWFKGKGANCNFIAYQGKKKESKSYGDKIVIFKERMKIMLFQLQVFMLQIFFFGGSNVTEINIS